MKIAYDGMPFEHSWIEGMHVYNQQVLTHLFRLYPENDYHFIFHSMRQDFANVELPGGNQNIRRDVLRIPTLPWHGMNLRIYFDYAMPRCLRKQGIDIYHGLRYYVPPSRKTRIVATFHDIFASVIPDMFSPKVRAERELWYQRAVKRSARIISASEATKDDLIRCFNVKEEKIVVIPLGASDIFKPVTDADVLARIRKKYDLDYNYIFALGSHPFRKNTERILRALALLVRAENFEHKLVLFGVSDDNRAKWMPLIEQLGLKEHVIFLRFVPTGDLPALYSMADIFLYPSLYEGFGIPVVEAMKCGTPVITSNMSAMSEVAGNAASLVDPLSIDDIYHALDALLADKDLRRKYSELGLERSGEYSWDNTARRTMAVYESVL